MCDEQKQIEEMAEHLIDIQRDFNEYCAKPCRGCELGGIVNCENYYKSEQLYKKGYRKQSEVIDEFVKRLKNAPIKCSLPLFGLQTKGEIEEYFNDIMLQFGNAIDNIAKEMKGE